MVKNGPTLTTCLFPLARLQYFANPTGSLVWIKCDPHHKDHVAILGDAAHAMVPFYGQVRLYHKHIVIVIVPASLFCGAYACVWSQGMNCCFEDVRVLDELLEQYNDDWDQVRSQHTNTIHYFPGRCS